MFTGKLAFLDEKLKWSCCCFSSVRRLNGGSLSVENGVKVLNFSVSIACLLQLISVLGRFLVCLFVLAGRGLTTGREEGGFNQDCIVSPCPLVCVIA